MSCKTRSIVLGKSTTIKNDLNNSTTIEMQRHDLVISMAFPRTLLVFDIMVDLALDVIRTPFFSRVSYVIVINISIDSIGKISFI